MKQFKDNMIPLISHEEIQKMVTHLAKQIEANYEDKEILLVCPLNGSIHFCADLTRQINLKQTIEFVKLISPKGESIRLLKDVSGDLSKKHVLIVEEIIDAGRSLSFLRNHIISGRPASLRIVTLIDKPSRRELPIRPDYIGRTIEDRFVIGYGMDSDGYGRNYKDIYIFSQ